jgi:hypothetical protein
VGKEMDAQLKVFFEHFNGMGKCVAYTVEAFNKMHASADSRLIPQAKRFQELGIGIEEISILEKS